MSILAYCAFKEPIYIIELLSMVCCFGGMVTITLSGAKSDERNYTTESLMLGYSLVFLCSWIYAGNCVLNRALKQVHHSIIMFYHGLLGLSVATVVVLSESMILAKSESDYQGMRILNYEGNLYWIILGAILFDSLAVNCLTIAYQSDSSGFVAIISFITIVYSFVADRVIFNESFTMAELFAALLIFMVTVITSIYKLRESWRKK